MPPELLVAGAVFCSVLFGMFGLHLYVKRDIERKIKAEHEERERARETSRAYWAARIQEIEQTKKLTPPIVALSLPLPHNPGPRRILKAE